MSTKFRVTTAQPKIPPEVRRTLRYLPNPRVPFHPHNLYRENYPTQFIDSQWKAGRKKFSPNWQGNPYTEKDSFKLEGFNIPITPRHELEKFMPDISIGPKAMVTPVSLMSARQGHRVTSDMIYSYDAYIGAYRSSAYVNHDNISPFDPQHVGLNPRAVWSRGRIYRWLRRGPFSQEDNYFRRYAVKKNNPYAKVPPEDVRLARSVIKLAKAGKLKDACEQYRRFVSIPPVQVYRALTAACIPQARLDDAVAIFEDGNTRLFYVSRDSEVLVNLMRCAISARARPRIMWVYNIARGTYYENKLVRAIIPQFTIFRLALLALEAAITNGWVEEARTLYSYLSQDRFSPVNSINSVMMMEREGNGTEPVRIELNNAETSLAPMTKYDLYYTVGLQLRKQLLAGQPIPKYSDEMVDALPSQKTILRLAAVVAQELQEQDGKVERNTDTPEEAVPYLTCRFPDLDVLAVLRLARHDYYRGRDLLASGYRTASSATDSNLASDEDDPPGPEEGGHANEEQQAAALQKYVQRAINWLVTLSESHQSNHFSEQPPLPFLRKSKPAAINSAALRVAWCPENYEASKILPSEQGFKFFFKASNGTGTVRFVEETFPQAGSSPASRYLAMQPIHKAVPATRLFPDRSLFLLAATVTEPTTVLQPPPSGDVLLLSTSDSSEADVPKTPQFEIHRSVLDAPTEGSALQSAAASLGRREGGPDQRSDQELF